MRQLERISFEKWLKGKQPLDVVGYRRHENCCPIANYLRDNGHPFPVVTFYTWGDAPGHIRTMPQWAESFVRYVDEQPKGEYPAPTKLPVIAKDALKILESIDA